MKVTKIKNRVLKESVNQLLEGTGNFYYENVCLLVTDEDYETGNYPAYESRPINENNNFPQYPLKDWNDDLCFWQIVMTPGYYEHACIDYVEVDCDDIYNDILYDAERNIDSYAFEDGKWTYEDVFMRHRGEDPEEHTEEDVIKAVREWVFSDYPIVTDEDIKQALERYKKDGYYAPSVFLCDSSIINKIEQQLREKEAEICEQRINEIAKEYGFRKLGTVARFSNGETIYDYIDEGLQKDTQVLKEGSQEKVYATALKNEQPLNNTELSALISDKADEWIAAGRITANTSFNDIEKMFRDEISKTANDIFVVKTFDIIKKRYLDGVKG